MRSKSRGLTLPAFTFPVAFWVAFSAIAATLERWWFPQAWDEMGLPASRFYFGDTRAFFGYAAALSAGERFDNGVPFHPPGWPLVLSLLFRAFGWSTDMPPDPVVLKHLGAVTSGASVGLAALLAYVLAGRGVMIITALLGVFHFGHMVQAAAPNSEPLYGLLIVLVLLGAVRIGRVGLVGRVGLTDWRSGESGGRVRIVEVGGESHRMEGWVLGALAGFTALVRAEFVLCAGLLAIWLTLDQAGLRQYRRAALFALGFLLALLPTTILNWRSIDEFNRTRIGSMPGALPRFAPITSYGAFSFANANHERADGGFNWDLPSLEPSDDEAADVLQGGHLDLARPAVYRAYVDGYWMGGTWLVSNPANASRLFGKKLAIMLSVFDFGYMLDNVPARVRGTRRPVDQIDLETSWVTFVHAVLVVGGLWIAASNPSTRVLLPPILTLLASSLLFFGYVRLGVAYLPVLWILQALAVARILGAIPVGPRWHRRAEFAAVGILAVLLLAEWAGTSRPRALMIDGLVDDDGRLVEDQKIEIVRVR